MLVRILIFFSKTNEKMNVHHLIRFLLLVYTFMNAHAQLSEEDFKKYLELEYETEASNVTNKLVTAEYDFATDINNKEKEEAKTKETLKAAEFSKDAWNKVFKDINTETFKDEFVKRQAELLKVLGNAALEETELEQFTEYGNYMTNIYSTGKICPFENQSCNLETDGLSLEPDIENILATSTNYEELEYVWKAWRDETGKKIKNTYKKYVNLSNAAANLNGFKDKGEMWKNDYQTENFEAEIDKLWTQVKPLYDELHTYVGRKLKERYGSKLDISDGLIPAHVFGNMWAQSWINLKDLVRPFPNANAIDVTTALKEQGYTALKMFETSNDFFLSLGLETNKMSYDEVKGAVIEKPNNREILCHASAWDFSDKKDFRIKMCTEVNYEDFITVHHEMGHIQYFILYKDQPIAFRTGANPGFHEAVGDTIALSVATAKHLKKINLLEENYSESVEADLNALMDMALERVAFLPFGLLIDKWRWDVFSGKKTEDEWNDHWWFYRNQIQKVKAPVNRSSDDFDPGAKYHVPGDSQYINYFVAHILEFQLYRSFCKLAKEYDPDDPNKPLHKCDFYQKKEVGTKLREGLSSGASEHWTKALLKMTGEKNLDGSAILEYFQPLHDYLKLQNDISTEEGLSEYLTNVYEKEASEMFKKAVTADWNYSTDINNQILENQLVNATLELGEFNKRCWTTVFKGLDENNYQDESLKRQIKLLKVIGHAALEEDKLEELTASIASMKNIYSTAKVCPYDNTACDKVNEGLSLEPDLERILATSTDYEELKHVWTEWRKQTGRKMKSTYQTYVELSNEAAEANGFEDNSQMWQSYYESDTFENDVARLWDQVKPLYDLLHSYVAEKLKDHYGDKLNIADGLIPAHVLGNMWGQSWINIASLVRPYPQASSVNVTAALIEKGYDVKRMFVESDKFYRSLGLEPNDMSYGPLAVIEKPEDREILCHASAWDFYDKEDFRIKMCTEVNYEDFITVHHEMGHIQYFILYKDQLVAFRNGANPGFHEAVGDTIALSVATPKHLQTIGLLDSYEESLEADINTLMDMALERVAFLPFGYLIDKWRWDVFSGKVDSTNWNERWWHYRETIQKLKPPEPRTEEDFDPGSKFHVPADSQYINYFIAHVLEFQLYRSLCKTAGQYDPNNDTLPLYKCDFYQSKEAGNQLRKGLSLGVSKHWKEVLIEMTGEDDLDATAILEYFMPLMKYFFERDETSLKTYIEGTYEEKASKMSNEMAHAQWDFATDVANEIKEEIQLNTTLKVAEFSKNIWTTLFKHLDEDDYSDEELKRQIQFLKVLGDSALEEEKLSELTSAVSKMTNIYSTAKICPYDKRDCNLETEGLPLEPSIESILAQSRDYDELSYVWSAWRDATGVKMKDTYKTYVALSNEAANINGFNDKGELWRSGYESPTFIDDMDKLWEQVKPLYNELHRYVAKKLQQVYKEKLDVSDGLIPAHLLGNMWGQSWINLVDIVTPYPEASKLNVTNSLIEKKYTVEKMFETSNEFFTSIGLESCDMSYGEKAVIIKPEDVEILCHASAWDFSDKKDFRIKMCTEINYEDFITVHHEMGHIEYYILYKDQPISFRDGANPGFHEAVGDTIALSVATPKHLKKIELLDENYENTYESDINALMDMALERVAFLPFGLLIDKWRWDVFAGTVDSQKWNAHWWHYRQTIQKLKPPVSRNDEVDFDPGAKYHVPGDSQYINYFFAHILEFQLYKALCIKAGESAKPEDLHKCDYYGSKEAGKALRAGLELGKSKHWKDVLETMTGSRELDASALVEYFQPLFNFLKESNGPLTNEMELENFLKLDYEQSASKVTYDSVLAEWNFVTDVSNSTKEAEQVAAALRLAELNKFYVENYFKDLDESHYEDPLIQRQVKKLKMLGNAALDTEDYEQYVETTAEMTNIYSKAKICPFTNQDCNLETEGLSLEPDIELIMATSNDYDELLYVWDSWRDASGKLIKDKYETYVDLSNKAAVANGFNDKGEMWRSAYESENFVGDIDKLWNEVKPLYDQLHKFVLRKLKERYADKIDLSDNLIPAHVLGNMWAQSWTNLFSLVKPYPNASAANITEGLLNQEYTVLKMFEKSDEFYVSLGLENNAMSYDVSLGAVIEKPADRDILCHASAWDFSNGKDFRIKMCTQVNHEDFITVHHEMGHIQYFIQYKDQPIAFRDSANPGFHEAIGDAIALSVANPKHLNAINLLEFDDDSPESNINSLMEMALERVAFLPFGLLVDKWRWDVFANNVTKSEWNTHWWKYRNEYQKVKTPVELDDDDFDPGAKYHVPGDSQYINYFVARILQFQIYKALCKEAGEYPDDKSVPLHKCDFYESTKAGDRIRNGLSLGSSKHWSDALEALTGERELKSDALLEYFQPLMDYLKAQNGEETDDNNQLVPIIVGSVIGVLLVAALSFYGYKRYKSR